VLGIIITLRPLQLDHGSIRYYTFFFLAIKILGPSCESSSVMDTSRGPTVPSCEFLLVINTPCSVRHHRNRVMSHPPPTTPPPHNFQLLFNNALKAYEKRTKNDLLAHPLAAQLQTCNSPPAILAVLHQQVQHLDQSRTADERWTKWLDPTVNVLYALSGTLGEGVGLVCLSS